MFAVVRTGGKQYRVEEGRAVRIDRIAGDPGDVRLISRPDMTWLWMIPLAGGRTSLGAVFDRDLHPSGADPAAALARIVATTPVVERAMRGARSCGAARFEGDFSYTVRSYAGDRWLLAGDAGSFLDPIFSTGVHLAVHGGLDAARALLAGSPRALRAYDFDPARFRGLRVPVMLQIGTESPRDLYGTDTLAAVLPDVRIEELPGQAPEGMTTAPEMYAASVTRFLLG